MTCRSLLLASSLLLTIGSATAANRPDGAGSQGGTMPEAVKCLKPEAVGAPQGPLTDPAIWGPLADLVGFHWIFLAGDIAVIHRFEAIENGNAIRYTLRVSSNNGCMREVIFHKPEEPGVWRADVNDYGDKSFSAVYRLTYRGTLLSDEKVTLSTAREEIGFEPTGNLIIQYQVETGADPTGPILPMRYEPFLDHEYAELAPRLAAGKASIEAKVRAEMEADEANFWAERKAKRKAFWNGLATGLQVVAQAAAEVAPAYTGAAEAGSYAESQANLDAAVANIQYAADVERQQQALAAQQEQARAAEANRQQLADNARWVAEKEQVAAEYRDGETQAAEARKAQLALKQQEDGQRRTAAEADRRKAQQDALREQGGVRAQATASGSLVLESVVNPSRRESTPPNSTADRQMLVACFLVHHGEFDQGKGVVFFSSTVPVAMEKGLAVGDPTGTFRRKVKSSYNIDGGTACQTLPDAAGLQSFMQEVGTSYRRYRKIDTGLSPLE